MGYFGFTDRGAAKKEPSSGSASDMCKVAAEGRGMVNFLPVVHF